MIPLGKRFRFPSFPAQVDTKIKGFQTELQAAGAAGNHGKAMVLRVIQQ